MRASNSSIERSLAGEGSWERVDTCADMIMGDGDAFVGCPRGIDEGGFWTSQVEWWEDGDSEKQGRRKGSR